MNNIEILDSLHPDLVNAFLRDGRCDGIPVKVQEFLKQIQWAAEIYEYERNITRAARKLHDRISAEQQQNVDVRTCKARIYSAITYFTIDNNVAKKVWESDFADKYENLAKLACARGDYDLQKKCLDAAHECRVRASQAAETESEWAPIYIISPNINLADFGFTKKSLKGIAKKSNDGVYLNGFYSKLIDLLPADESEKKRLRIDAEVEDAQILQEDEE